MEFLYKYGWYAMLAAMAGDLLVSWLLGLLYKDYSCLDMSISALGNPASPVRIPFNIWMMLEGVLFLAAIPAFFRCYDSAGRIAALLCAVCIAAFAVGACIFTGFFSVNESKDVVTAASRIHGAGSAIGFMLFLFVPLFVAVLSFKAGERGIGVAGIVGFAAAMATFVLFVMSDKPAFAGTLIAREGLWQRLNLIFMYMPLAVVALKRIGG